MSSRLSKTFSQVILTCRFWSFVLTCHGNPDVYRIVSNKALEQSESEIKPTPSISVTASADGPSGANKSGCC